MVASLITVLLYICPLMMAGILHMLIVKLKLASFLARPLHVRLFGQNKTWRGILLMPLCGIIGVASTKALFPGADSEHVFDQPLLLGAALGLAYVLFELPNSFIKRRLGVPPGQLPETNRLLFFVLDHFDSTLGCILAYALLTPADPRLLLLALIVAPLVHIVINFLLWALGIRKEKF